MRTRAGMGAGRFRWFMFRQRLPQSSPEAITDLPPARVIRGKDPHALLGLLGLGTSRHTLTGTSLLDLGGLRTEIQDQRDQGRDVAWRAVLTNPPVFARLFAGNWRAASFNIAWTPPVTPPLPKWIGMTINSSPAAPVTSRTRRSSDRRFSSCRQHSRKLGEESVERGSLPSFESGVGM